LDVIIKEDLCNRASQTGAMLKAGLNSLAERYPIIGQIRGKGLLWGLEFVEDRNTRRPFAASLNIAQRLTDLAFREGLIIYPRRSLNGLAGDHVLVAPPLIIKSDEVSEVLRRLERAMDFLMDELDR
jgi:4-aminobutyrate aminotransferase-like enzyme